MAMELSRRGFLQSAALFGASTFVSDSFGRSLFTGKAKDFDDSLMVFFSDVHVRGGASYQRDSFVPIVAEVLKMNPLPRNVVIFGDFAYLSGKKEDNKDSGKTTVATAPQNNGTTTTVTVTPDDTDATLPSEGTDATAGDETTAEDVTTAGDETTAEDGTTAEDATTAGDATDAPATDDKGGESAGCASVAGGALVALLALAAAPMICRKKED